jgi:hypothetical protein
VRRPEKLGAELAGAAPSWQPCSRGEGRFRRTRFRRSRCCVGAGRVRAGGSSRTWCALSPLGRDNRNRINLYEHDDNSHVDNNDDEYQHLAGCGGNKKAYSKIVVPNVIGLRSPAAQRLVESRGLRWRGTTMPSPARNAFFMNDEIVGQTLPPGRHVKRGTELILVPSSVKLVVSPLG